MGLYEACFKLLKLEVILSLIHFKVDSSQLYCNVELLLSMVLIYIL